METDVQKGAAALRELLGASRTAVFLGGAGVSTESGLADFRSESARQSCLARYGYEPEAILSKDCLYGDPALFFSYYRETLLREAVPNAAHIALAKLEARGKLSAVLTQNVDMLHEAAGSRRVLKLHGSIGEAYCLGCGARFGLAHMRASKEAVPRCTRCGGLLRPDIVLYGEAVNDYVFRMARAFIQSADTLLVGGSSLAAYPAAALPQFFMGKRLIVINREATPLDPGATLILRAPIAAVFASLEL